MQRLAVEATLIRFGYTVNLSNETFEGLAYRLMVVQEIQKLEAEEQEKAQREQERGSRNGAQTASLSRPIDPRPRPSLGRNL